MNHLLELFHSEHDDDLLDFDLHMLQAWLVVAPPSKFYIVSTVIFNKDEGANVAVTNFMLHYSMFVPTKSTVKLDNGSTLHTQVIGIFLCRFPKCSVIYTVGPVYYFQVTLPTPSHHVTSNFMLAFKKLRQNLLNIVTLLTLKVVLGYHSTRLKTILTIFKSKLSKSTLTDTGILLYQLSVYFQNKISLRLFISFLVVSLLPD